MTLIFWFFFTERGALLLTKHLEQQTTERKKLSKHRKKCLANPKKYIGIVIDGMDQKKTRLPHWSRPPKSVDESCLIQLHVVGCLVFHKEIFSRVFLNYPTLRNDGNLTITILQRVFHEWSSRAGGLPPILYLQLDNTARENKNNLLFSYLHMLIQKKVFKKIKVGFLLVGHTHDQIDQMFSRFSIRLRKSKAFVYEDLCEILRQSYTPTPVITLLTEAFDFRKYALEEPSITVNTLRNVSFSHQFKIQFSREADKVPRMWAKKFSTSSNWAPEEGVIFLKDDILEGPVWAAEILPLSKKGERVQGSLEKIQNDLADVEKGILGSRILFSDEEISWWEEFFEAQRNQNAGYLVQDRRLKVSFVWPAIQENEIGLVEEDTKTGEALNEKEINLRVYGESRDIYVGGYRNQQAIELEKKNMDGDFSDMQIGSFMAIASEGCLDKRPFWIAKVEKIVSENENGVPKLVEVLWFAVKKGQDMFKGKYAPEVLAYEKHQRKKRRQSAKTVMAIQELDITSTTVFAYNFFLNSTGCLYKKSIDRIQIRLEEYLRDKDVLREEARLARILSENESEASSSSSGESQDYGTSPEF
jgi:hypothetical protein